MKVKRQPIKSGDPFVYRTEQRIDGFVSVDSAYMGGALKTRTFLLESDTLKLNINTSSSGTAHAALLYENDKIIEGFGFDECDLIHGNYTEKTVSWKKKINLAHLKGRNLKLALRSRATKLYAVYP